MLLSKLFIILTSLILSQPVVEQDTTTFIHPLKIPIVLSASFAELRANHFHSGVDFKTQGVIGQEVVAPADGYVYRIGVSPSGYGNALYIRHPSGVSTVYGHLDRFIPEIEEYVTEQQYEQKSFSVSLFPPSNMFHFKQGDLIGYSGNSGGSTGPHLHFEVRNSANEHAMDPLFFDIGAKDTRKPVVTNIAIYTIEDNSTVNGKYGRRLFNVEGDNGKYYIHPNTTITLHGRIGFGIKAYDLLNGANNKCGIRSIELYIDSVLHYKHTIDEFSFDETKYINSHIDYDLYKRNNLYLDKLFVAPNDQLSIYDELIDDGTVTFNDNKTHSVEMKLFDSTGNISILSFKVKSDAAEPSDIHTDTDYTYMPYNETNVFRANNIYVSISSGTFYDNVKFKYDVTEGGPNMYSDLHHVHNIYTPVHKTYTLKIKPTSIPKGKVNKLIITLLNGTRRYPVKTTYTSDGYLTAFPSDLGDFYVDIDTVAPKITPVTQINGANLSGKKEMRIKITDNFSGISSYSGTIDGEWALFEYDSKNAVLIYKFSKARIQKSKQHTLSVKVKDVSNNESTYGASFYW